MNMLKMAALSTALAALSFGCDDDYDYVNLIDASAKADAGGDGGQGHDGGMFACPSWMPPENGMCGGPHCKQTEAELRAATPPTAACGSDMEVASFCSQTVVNKVSMCTVQAFITGVPNDQKPSTITSCTRETYSASQVSDACLNCYVNSAVCAGDKCFSECLDPNTAACDTCRWTAGCISTFYACSGFTLP